MARKGGDKRAVGWGWIGAGCRLSTKNTMRVYYFLSRIGPAPSSILIPPYNGNRKSKVALLFYLALSIIPTQTACKMALN